MLILSRRAGESITIGDEVTVTVLAINGNQIRLGIDAPRDVAVHREEIYRKIAEQQQTEQEDQPAAPKITQKRSKLQLRSATA